MLSDPNSAIIRRFGLLREDVPPDSRDYGIPYPGTLLVDAAGIVRERFFEERYWHRMTIPSALWHLGVALPTGAESLGREHLRIRTSASDATVYPGNRFTLLAEVELAPGVHVYGPAVGGGYQGLELSVDPLPVLTVHSPSYPPARRLTLPWTGEPLTGYTQPVRVAVDVSLGTRQELAAVLESGQGLTLTGTLRLQACDDRVCWPPEAVPLTWHVDLIQPDLERSPEPLQHKPKAKS